MTLSPDLANSGMIVTEASFSAVAISGWIAATLRCISPSVSGMMFSTPALMPTSLMTCVAIAIAFAEGSSA